jgi:hypothetical protein
MVVDDFHIVGVAVPPHEANAILIIDSDAVLALALAVQSLQSVSGGTFKLSSATEACNKKSFFIARIFRLAGIRRLRPVCQSCSVSASRKLAIMEQ